MKGTLQLSEGCVDIKDAKRLKSPSRKSFKG